MYMCLNEEISIHCPMTPIHNCSKRDTDHKKNKRADSLVYVSRCNTTTVYCLTCHHSFGSCNFDAAIVVTQMIYNNYTYVHTNLTLAYLITIQIGLSLL